MTRTSRFLTDLAALATACAALLLLSACTVEDDGQAPPSANAEHRVAPDEADRPTGADDPTEAGDAMGGGPAERTAERTADRMQDETHDMAQQNDSSATARREIATFGAGCFWCTEAVLEQLGGVLDVRAGYMGGTVPNPTYRQVCTGTTGHAEVVQVTFDPARIGYEKLLDYFWKLHDPTTLNRQGADVGTQYRSVIFWHTEEQRRLAEKSRDALDASGAHPLPVVTEITEASKFYEAEDYHQDYYRENRQAPYCRAVIVPKLDKLGLEK